MMNLKELPMFLKELTPIQVDYLKDWKHRFIVVSAGRRSRKTLIGQRKILLFALRWGGVKLFHGAPTRQQAKHIFWNSLKKNTQKFWSRRPNESDLIVYLRNESEIHVVGLDVPARIEGQTPSWAGGHIAEFADVKFESIDNHIMPCLAETNNITGNEGFLIIDGVPEMGNPDYRDLAKMAAGGAFPVTVPKYGGFGESSIDPEWCFYTWFSSDVLKKSEIERIQRTCDPKVFRQEYEGSFEKLEGQVYHGFTPDYYPNGNFDKSVVYDKNLPIVMGFDFNVNPMTACLGHVKRNEKKEQEWHIFKSYFLPDSNTKKLCERIITEYNDTDSFFLTPCQSSIARQTSQEYGKTDLKIIENSFKEYGKILSVDKRSKNPKIKDRVNAANAMLYHNRIRINPDEIGNKYLIRDWEGLKIKPGTSDIDYSNKMLGHLSAGFDYVCDYRWPIRRDI